MSDLEFDRTLVLSTEHISPATSTWLDTGRTEDTYPGLLADYYAGWILWAEESPHESYPDDLKAIFAFARSHGCNFVRLDQDGPTIEELPYHDW